MAEWSCSGLQIRVRRFDSDSSLHSLKHLIPGSYRDNTGPDGEIGRHKGLKISLVKSFLLKSHGQNVKKDKALQAHKALFDDLFW